MKARDILAGLAVAAALAGSGCMFTTQAVDIPRGMAPGTAGGEAYRIYWGDLHAHSGFSSDYRDYSNVSGGKAADCPADPGCQGLSAAGYFFRNALSNRLDFAAITDHAEDLSAEEWEDTRAAAIRHDLHGRFVPILGYEFCEVGLRDVHCANVFLPDLRGGRIFASATLRKPTAAASTEFLQNGKELWRKVGSNQPGALGFLVYTQSRMQWDFAEMDRKWIFGAEVSTTGGGISRLEYRQCHPEALAGWARGIPAAVLGTGNSHDGRPGQSSLTAVLARDLSRESLFDALRNRRTYATRGARISLDFKVDGHPMGALHELPQGGEVLIRASAVHYDSPLQVISIYRVRDGKKERLLHHAQEHHSLETSLSDTLAAGDTALYWMEANLKGQDPGFGAEAWTSPVQVRVKNP